MSMFPSYEEEVEAAGAFANTPFGNRHGWK
jgi:hypothetical protein